MRTVTKTCGFVPLLLACACLPDPEIVRPPPGDQLESIAGPALGGPYDSYPEALLAACQKVLRKPDATAGPHNHEDFIKRWMLSTEYCAWIYYTPSAKYELSKLSNHTKLPYSEKRRSCFLPQYVDDPRYPVGTIKYISAFHNHPYGNTLSDGDIRTIVAAGFEHGFTAETRDGTLNLAVVAFFSKSYSRPTCDGFYMYAPAKGRVVKWDNVGGDWHCQQIESITWQDESNFSREKREGSCSEEDAP
jgi:hypothetical protein